MFQMTDGGPLYTETDLQRFIVEPFNAASAFLFLILSVYWLVKLKGQYGRNLILTISLPILLIGAIGGTFYHAFRVSEWLLLMDWLPIMIICILIGAYFWYKINMNLWLPITSIPVFIVIQRLTFVMLNQHHANNLSYALLGLYILIPGLFYLSRTNFLGARYLLLALISFSIALFCRYLDPHTKGVILIGSHWLWHVFGALAGHFLTYYLFVNQDVPAVQGKVILKQPTKSS